MPGVEANKLFSVLNDREREVLRSVQRTRVCTAGEHIFQEGDRGDGIYIISTGQVHISAKIGSEERGVLAKLGPGEVFGEMAVLDNEPRSGTATAVVPTELLFIPREKLIAILESSPRLSVNLVREFSLRMRDFNKQYIREVLQAERLALVGRFARSIVHDFKNPLSIIGLAAEMVRMEKLDLKTRDQAAERISKQVVRLSNMINEILDFTRGSSNPLVLGSVNYRSYMRQLVQEAELELAAKKPVSLKMENEPPDVELLLDGQRLMHVFYNLFHNAADAISESGVILLRFAATPNEVVTEVEDTGPGFAPEILPRLFEAFATHGKAHGTGLGLSICKRIIEDHRGEISARQEPGRGAIFEIRLPRQPVKAPAPR
jgi:signal transduction histidine kinase